MTVHRRSARIRHVAIVLVPVVAALPGCGPLLAGGANPLVTVDQVDVQRYMGTWYEIARYPNSFERGCSAVTAEYTLRDDGTVRVLNTCRDSDGVTVKSTTEGFAEIADPSTNAKLTVYFFYPFGAPYWIIDLDEDYQYAVVGDPSRCFLLLLIRTPTLDAATYDQILQRLPEQGYDPQRLELTPQFEDSAN
jgi:apolipoprotein D and lipocalin family protein